MIWMDSLLVILASNGFSDVEPGYIRDWLIVLACLMGLALLAITFTEKIRGKVTDIKVNHQPVDVRQVFDVPTREEFNELKVEVKAIEKSLPIMERRILDAIRDGLKETSEMIERVSERAYQGRKEIHTKLNEQGREIAAMQATSKKG